MPKRSKPVQVFEGDGVRADEVLEDTTCEWNGAPAFGPYERVTRHTILVKGGRQFRVLTYGQYNANGLIGSESNGICILDDDQMAILVDEYCCANSGWGGPTAKQQQTHTELVNATWDEFRAAVNGSGRRRYTI